MELTLNILETALCIALFPVVVAMVDNSFNHFWAFAGGLGLFISLVLVVSIAIIYIWS